MTLPSSVRDVVAEHVTFEVDCIDRMYLNVYVPGLQFPAGLVGYVHRQLGLPIASTAPLARITDRFAAAVHRYARDLAIPWVDFVKGQRKDDVLHEQLARFEATGRGEGVVFIGRAQEKTTVFRTEKRHNADGRPYPWIVRGTGMVNHFYFYCLDEDFGPFFLKFCSYFPYNARLCVNGNHWAQRQAAKAGLGFTPMDNAFAAVDDPGALQEICDRLGAEQIEVLLRKWPAILSHPFTPADRADGYRYDISILQQRSETGSSPLARLHADALLLARATGVRIGELRDLGLDCLHEIDGHGAWLKVPLGKLGTERMVPVDEETITVIDRIAARRTPGRPLPAPTHRPAGRVPAHPPRPSDLRASLA
ncbi:MAG: hypothetical protein ABJA34_10285 [Pseudonocardiales bacterium]